VIRALLALLLATGLSGCSSLGHWSQALGGHLAVLGAARPVDDWLADPATPPALAERLRLARQMRAFASVRLALPDNASYRRYADLHRPAVVWNLVAAPEFGFALKTWCYPVMGCAGYRGYFERDAARAEGERLLAEGWEVQVLGVPAYSTLGWSSWLGGDPLLNTFIDHAEGELAGLIFHELAHQRVYVADDTGFNEAYASAVELLGARAWLTDKPAALAAFEAGRARRLAFVTLARTTRERLATLYAATNRRQPSASPRPNCCAPSCRHRATSAGSPRPTTPASRCWPPTTISCPLSSASSGVSATTGPASTRPSGAWRRSPPPSAGPACWNKAGLMLIPRPVQPADAAAGSFNGPGAYDGTARPRRRPRPRVHPKPPTWRPQPG